MSRNKIHSDGISVPFRWEKHPGISKVSSSSSSMIESEGHSQKLPPPPCLVKKPAKSGVGSVTGEDPFLMALKVCTKSKKSNSDDHHRKLEVGFGLIKKNLLRVSCKHSIGVRDDALTPSRY